MSSPLWAVTCLFNPQRYKRRSRNYREFREGLGIPLLTVELSFDGAFELDRSDADILVPRVGGDVMWQKERLLNLGIRHLPPECAAVAVLDSDIIFESPSWPSAALRALDDSVALQPFEVVHFSDRDHGTFEAGTATVTVTQHSVASRVSQGMSPGLCLGRQTGDGRGSTSPGLAWVYRREFLERHGLFEGCIIGGGDTAVASASFGVFGAVEERHQMNESQRRYYRTWAEPWRQDLEGRVAFIEGDLLHLWHGDLVNRLGAARHAGLVPHAFDPHRDIAAPPDGAWQWATDKPDMHSYVRDYFAARLEDG